jgi:hypothetical protein
MKFDENLSANSMHLGEFSCELIVVDSIIAS